MERASPIRKTTSKCFHADLAVVDFNQINVGLALTAFLAFGTGLTEDDIAVQAFHVDIPQRGLDRCRLRFARLLNGGRCGADTVVAAEALGTSGKVEAALLPFGDEVVRCLRVRR